MKIDAFASEEHYRAHVNAVWRALPQEHRGAWARHGEDRPVIVCSYNDLRAVGDRQVIFMEHGAGQTYGGDLASYAGSSRRDHVRLFLCPSERVAALNRAAHPHINSVVVGMPRLDPWVKVRNPSSGVVALAWHWEGLVVPEARSALPHYAAVLDEISHNYQVIGTAHPRIAQYAERIYQQLGIPFVTEGEVFTYAQVMACDNTSLGWDFIALDRPVVWCNAPWYRRFVNHGLRFWDQADSGIMIDEPWELAGALTRALEEDPTASRRAEVAPYGVMDGKATQRAVAAILEEVG